MHLVVRTPLGLVPSDPRGAADAESAPPYERPAADRCRVVSWWGRKVAGEQSTGAGISEAEAGGGSNTAAEGGRGAVGSHVTMGTLGRSL
jgi:hypothetical protein